MAPALLETPAPTDQIIITKTTSGSISSPGQDILRAARDTPRLGVASLTPRVVRVVQRDAASTTSVVDVGQSLNAEEMSALTEELLSLPGVVSATPDIRVYPASVSLPDDPDLPSLWGLWNSNLAAGGSADGGTSVRGPAAWPTSTGAGTIVAVIDTGITSHPDLAGKTVAGYDFIANAADARDGNGYDSDPADMGDWSTGANCRSSSSSWHGTHVAGTIAAVTNNGVGIAGVAPDASIMPIRVLGECGGYLSDVEQGMRWAAGLDTYDQTGLNLIAPPIRRADVINLSLGGSGSCSSTTQSLINQIVAAGTTVVVAAGNSSVDVAGSAPANCTNIVAVAATTELGQRASFSNYGAGITVAAPGVSILSTYNTGTQSPSTSTYAWSNGTSMAAPHIAGVAALMYARDDSATPAQVRTALINSARDFPAGSTCAGICGAGLADAPGAVLLMGAEPTPTPTPTPPPPAPAPPPPAPAPPPPAPVPEPTPEPIPVPDGVSDLAAQAMDSGAVVSWAPPANSEGVLGYEVDVHTNGETVRQLQTSATMMVIRDLENGRGYVFSVAAVNESGVGTQTESAILTPVGVPGVPRSVKVRKRSGETVLRWRPPGDSGGAQTLEYVVQIRIGRGKNRQRMSWVINDRRFTVPDLGRGGTYRIRIAAQNTAGVSAFSKSKLVKILVT